MSEQESEQKQPTAGVNIGRKQLTFWQQTEDGKRGSQYVVQLPELIRRAKHDEEGGEAMLLLWGQFMLLDEIRQTVAMTAQMQAEAMKRARQSEAAMPKNPEELIRMASEFVGDLHKKNSGHSDEE